MTTYVLSGTVRDINGIAVSGAAVKAYDTATDTLQGQTTSASDGTYSISMTNAGPLYAVAYHPNSPDTFGTTLNTLMPVAQGGSPSDPIPIIF